MVYIHLLAFVQRNTDLILRLKNVFKSNSLAEAQGFQKVDPVHFGPEIFVPRENTISHYEAVIFYKKFMKTFVGKRTFGPGVY